MSSGLAALEGSPAPVWELDEFESVPFRLVQNDELKDSQGGEDAALRAEFDFLADELEEATSAMSSTRRAAAHPAYSGILALGDRAIPHLLRRVQTSRHKPVFLRLLGSLTAFQPGAGRDSVTAAAEAWVRWGRREGRID